MTTKKYYIGIIVAVILILTFSSVVKAEENPVNSEGARRLTTIKSPQLNKKDPKPAYIDDACNYITKQFFTHQLEYYINQKILDNNAYLGPKKGDSITLDNVLPLSQSNIQIGQESFDLQPNITIWDKEWYGITSEESQIPGFTDTAMAVASRNDSDTSYSNLTIGSGSLDQNGIEISSSGNSITITRTSDVDLTDASSKGSVQVSADFKNNYGTAYDTGGSFCKPWFGLAFLSRIYK